MLDATVAALEAADFLEIKRGETLAFDTAQVAAASFHPQSRLFGVVERIALIDFRAGVSAAEVGDAQIAAEQVRAVAEEFRLIQSFGSRFIPAIFKIAQTCG